MNLPQSDRPIDLDRLQADLIYLEDAYGETMRQFNCSLSAADRPKLEAELAALDRQITAIEIQIKSISID